MSEVDQKKRTPKKNDNNLRVQFRHNFHVAGQHQCVAVINNFYDKSDLEYYTVPRGESALCLDICLPGKKKNGPDYCNTQRTWLPI